MVMNPMDALLQRMFGRPSGLLGRLGGRLMTGDDKREMAEWALSELDVEPTDHVLEVGFGPGLGIEAATAVTPGGFVAGVDYSREMVEMARNRNTEAINAGHVDLRYGSVDDLPYEDAIFDVAFSVNSMQVWPEEIAGLEELRRVLKPGGRVALGFTPIANQSGSDVQPILREAGFRDVQVRERDVGICVIASP